MRTKIEKIVTTPDVMEHRYRYVTYYGYSIETDMQENITVIDGHILTDNMVFNGLQEAIEFIDNNCNQGII